MAGPSLYQFGELGAERGGAVGVRVLCPMRGVLHLGPKRGP